MENKHVSPTRILFFTSILTTTLLLSIAQVNATYHLPPKPKATIIIVVDAFAHHYLNTIRPNLTDGLKTILNDGLFYNDAHIHHSKPQTAPGHTALATGTYPHDHGIIGNCWFDTTGKKIYSVEDTSEAAAVFSPTGIYDYGRSAKNICVDGLSDQIKLSSPDSDVYALSIKSRAAIPMAGKTGKAIWLNDTTGTFTSSTAYFKNLPQWLINFNTAHAGTPLKSARWFLSKPDTPDNYPNTLIQNYALTSYNTSLIEDTAAFKPNEGSNLFQCAKKSFYLVEQSPIASELLIKLAKTCIDTHYKPQSPHHFVLWISLSNLDKLSHIFGPNSREAIDTIYHMDEQIGKLIAHAHKKIGAKNILFALASDHGIMPIPELLQQRNYPAQRINPTKLIDSMNTIATKKFGIRNLIQEFKTPQFFLRESLLRKLAPIKRRSLIKTLKRYLLTTPGIKKVWTRPELTHLPIEAGTLATYFKNQIYHGRSGFLICHVHPYTQMTNYLTGTDHQTPYDYDTHIPLALYYPGHVPAKTIYTPVSSQQLPRTLAEILHVPKPSACTFGLLPEVFPNIVAH